jgi:hypothetical protein
MARGSRREELLGAGRCRHRRWEGRKVAGLTESREGRASGQGPGRCRSVCHSSQGCRNALSQVHALRSEICRLGMSAPTQCERCRRQGRASHTPPTFLERSVVSQAAVDPIYHVAQRAFPVGREPGGRGQRPGVRMTGWRPSRVRGSPCHSAQRGRGSSPPPLESVWSQLQEVLKPDGFAVTAV